jgi:hypothetical protein
MPLAVSVELYCFTEVTTHKILRSRNIHIVSREPKTSSSGINRGRRC